MKNTKNITLRVPEELHRALSEKGDDVGITLHSLIVMILLKKFRLI